MILCIVYDFYSIVDPSSKVSYLFWWFRKFIDTIDTFIRRINQTLIWVNISSAQWFNYKNKAFSSVIFESCPRKTAPTNVRCNNVIKHYHTILSICVDKGSVSYFAIKWQPFLTQGSYLKPYISSQHYYTVDFSQFFLVKYNLQNLILTTFDMYFTKSAKIFRSHFHLWLYTKNTA